MYVHCHNCPWGQDDFWTRRYNPASILWSEIKWLWIPKMVWTETKVFSWFWLARCFKWRLSAPFRQKWWTLKDWHRAIEKNGERLPPCPKCGEYTLVTD